MRSVRIARGVLAALGLTMVAVPGVVPAHAATAPPSHFTVGAISASEIRLSWDRVGNHDFEVTNGVTSHTVFAVPKNTVTYTWSGLSTDEWMCFRVRTLATSGNSEWVPGPPQNFLCAYTLHTNSDQRSFPLEARGDTHFGTNGLHSHEFPGLTDDPSGTQHPPLTFENEASAGSLDWIAGPSGGVQNGPATVTAVQEGDVILTNQKCHTVVVDSGSDWWLYMHLNPSVQSGQHANRDTKLGVLASPKSKTCPSEDFGGVYHVHLVPLTETGDNTGSYESLQGRFFCGHPIRTPNVFPIVEGLTATEAQGMTIPKC